MTARERKKKNKQVAQRLDRRGFKAVFRFAFNLNFYNGCIEFRISREDGKRGNKENIGEGPDKKL